MQHWRHTAKTIAVTAVVTSAAWVIAGGLYIDGLRTHLMPAVPAPSAAVGLLDPVSYSGKPPADAIPVPVQGDALPAPVPRQLTIPVEGVRPDQLVDTFTEPRGGGERVHQAIDILAPTGTPVVAAAPGRVEKLFVSARGGNTVYIRSPDRALIYYYAHLDAYAPGLAAGQEIAQGQRIGTVGYSGDANPAAPHLHFEIQQTTPTSGWWQHTRSLNPFPLLGGRSR